MNYAQKELHEAVAYLNAARAEQASLKEIQRAFILDEPVEVTFRSTRGTVTALCPGKPSAKLLEKLLERVETRVEELEKQEVYWCSEVAMLDKEEKLRVHLMQIDRDTGPSTAG
ncbi:hypothetical protein [Solirubrum puertoriconensis]|uniref:Uncharacterized protein n=1 Tax=Solirubrum puertoriconensis TaxID=1751427 RepID=A0A9X0HNP5_SOLP1|nr:hypothetical protein [Solirubrum puertoriconensis]KUG09393.1 hypothetical protein ASU33_16830 [Solirubrum puertoriconensis]